MVVAVAITILFPGLLYWLSGGQFVHDDFKDAFRAGSSLAGDDSLFVLFYILTGLFALFLTPIFFQINVAIVNWLANKLGGSGDSNPLGFLLGAILVPGYIGDAIFEVFPFLLGMVLRYMLILAQAVLIVIALRATKSLSWVRAVGVLAIIGIVILVLMGILFGCLLLTR